MAEMTRLEALEIVERLDAEAKATSKRRRYGHADEVLQNVKGVPREGDREDLLTSKGGKIIPAEFWDGEPTWKSILADEAMTEEEEYSEHLEMGFPRIPKWEAAIDMSLIDEELLDMADPKWEGTTIHTPAQFKNEKDG